MNRDERLEWLDNDEGLYAWWSLTGLTRRMFVTEHRLEIDEYVENVNSGRKSAHYLAYGDGRS